MKLRKYPILFKCVTLFLLMLLVTLPFVSASRIASVSVVGADGLRNIINEDDEVTFEATVLNTDGYNAEDVQFRLTLGNKLDKKIHVFQNCTGTSSVTCTFTDQISHDTQYNAFDYVATLYNSPSLVIEDSSYEGTYYVDTTAPAISLGALSQNSGTVLLPITIKDTLSPSFTSRCSGIATVTITFDGEEIYSDVGSGCEFIESVSVDLADQTTGGTHQFCVESADVVGNQAKKCRQFTLDLVAPQIQRLRIMSGNIDPLFFIPKQGANANVAFEISGDFKEGTERVLVNNQSYDLTCGGGFCIAENLFISNATSFRLEAFAKDKNGNEGSLSVLQNIAIDTTAPVVNRVESNLTLGGKSYYTHDSIIVADVAETESGFYKNSLSISVAGNTAKADCANTNTSWVCIWDNTGFVLSDGEHEFRVSGFDDAQNQVGGNLRHLFIVDKTAPEVSNIRIEPANNVSDFVEGERIQITFSYTDTSSISAVADFSEFGAGNGSATCAQNRCTVTSQRITQGGKYAAVPITVTDIAGNVDVVNSPSINVLRLADGGENHFTHSLSMIPDKFENSSSQYMNQRAYADVKVKPVGSGEVRSVRLLSCQSIGGGLESGTQGEPQQDDEEETFGFGSTGGNNRAATAFETFGNAGSTGSGDFAYFQNYSEMPTGTLGELMIQLTLKAVKIQQPSIQIECDVEVTGVSGDTLVESEIEKVYLQWGVYELGVGSLPDNYEQELEQAYKDATEGMLNTIASWNKYVRWAENICRAFSSIKGIVKSLGNLGITLDALGTATGGSTTLAASSICSAAETTDETTDGLFSDKGPISKVCQFVNCQWSLTSWLMGGGLGSGGGGGLFGGGDLRVRDAGAAPVNDAPLGQNLQVTWANSLNEKTLIGGGENTNFKFGLGDILGWNRINTKDNLVMSVINLCIPGIIHNLDKLRQIKCRYALCLLEDVPAGTPKQACDAAKEFAQCQYVYGQIFALIPLVNLWDHIVGQIQSFFSSPFALIGAASRVICLQYCYGKPGTISGGYEFCKFASLLNEMGTLIKHVMTIVNIFQNPDPSQADYCSDLEEKWEAREEAKQEAQEYASAREEERFRTQYQTGGIV